MKRILHQEGSTAARNAQTNSCFGDSHLSAQPFNDTPSRVARGTAQNRVSTGQACRRFRSVAVM